MEITDLLVILMLVTFIGLLMTGFQITFVLSGLAVVFAVVGYMSDMYLDTATGLDFSVLGMIVMRVFKLMSNWVLVAIPMFIYMGMMLDRSGIAEKMMDAMQRLFGRVRGGLAVSVALIGIILAASTGIIGASVVLLGVLSLPLMLRQGYNKSLALGTVAASGTLGILIPPSIMLVIMADQLNLSVGDLFIGAVVPGLILGVLYIVYILLTGYLRPTHAPLPEQREEVSGKVILEVLKTVLPPMGLIVLVLGSIFAGVATRPRPAAWELWAPSRWSITMKKLSFKVFKEVNKATFKTCSYIFGIFFGAQAFALVLRMLGGDEFIERLLLSLPFGPMGIIAFIIGMVFLLGFFLDWIEISLIFLPLLAPVLPGLGLDVNGYGVIEKPELVWFAVLVAVTLQTSFLTPPVGFTIFFLQGVAPEGVVLLDIYKGVVGFVILQLIGLALVFLWPQLVLWLPALAYG